MVQNWFSFPEGAGMRLEALRSNPNRGTKILKTIKDTKKRDIDVRANSLGAVAWIYGWKYDTSLPQPGMDGYTIYRKDGPGFVNYSIFQNLLNDNDFRVLDYVNGETPVKGDVVTLQGCPEEYGCFDVWGAGVYIRDITTNTFDVFGQDDVRDDASYRFGQFIWDETRKIVNDYGIHFWRKSK